jgi:import inner membrane translocase subunit TIM17
MADGGDREPCPFRVFEDMGGGFLLGSVGGFAWHFVKGYRNAPIGQRWSGAFASARIRAPVLGGQFGVWGGLFSVFDCSLAALRRREDAWNAIAAGGLTGGLLAARAGPAAIARNAAGGAFILALIEGVMMLVTKMILKAQNAQAGGRGVAVDRLEPPVPPGYASRSAGVADSFQLA